MAGAAHNAYFLFMSNSTDGVQSVDRALSILSMLARRGELGVTEIAADLGVHKSTAFRLVATLEGHDLVEQSFDRGKYRLGLGILRLAGSTRVNLNVVQESRPLCVRLAEEVGETVNVTVLAGHEALYLDQAAGPAALQLHNWVGRRIALHATSNGKVLLAFAAPAVFDEICATVLERFTEHTITSPSELAKQLAEVRERGYATAVDELEIGLTAVAAPILDADGAVVASVSASGPSFRMPREALPGVAEKVTTTAALISARLGWHGDRGRADARL